MAIISINFIIKFQFLLTSSRVSFSFSIRVSTFALLKTIGGLIFNTLCFGPSLLISTNFSLIIVMIFFANYPSYYLDYLLFTISIPWKSPIPLISPTKSYRGKIYYFNLLLRYRPVSLAFS